MIDVDQEARVQLQARLALLARLAFATFCLLAAFILALTRFYPMARPHAAHVVFGYGIAAAALCTLIWFRTVHGRRPSLAVLYRIDALLTLAIGVVLGVTAFFYTTRFAAIFSGLVITVFTRSIVVPSTGPRTLTVATLAFAPLFTSAGVVALLAPQRLDLPILPFMASVALFAALAIALAATGSQVIYGLRRRVSQAQQLGQYTLEGRIGAGGMGEVYRARHAMLRRPTAIKLLLPSRHDEECLARFEREVQLTSRLTHPNTVAVYDYGRSPDGIFYYVMEYLDGVDLATLVERHGPQPPGRVVHVLRQLCGALDEAHRLGVIHRDVKPANVMLCRRGVTADVAKLLDFGLVQDVTAAGTRSRSIVGTPSYISPEAVTSPERVGPASDIYSLAATGYFLLTGTPVFDGARPLELCARHATAAPVPPSRRCQQHVPAELEALLLACLAKDPAARPDARSLAAALLALPVHDEWTEDEAGVWWRRFDALRDTTAMAAAVPPTTLTVDLSCHDDAARVAA